MGSGEGFNDKTIVRYNIFQNNAHHAIRFSGETTNTTIHKNVFYCGPEISNQYIVWHKDWRGYTDNSFYYNNVFDHNIFFDKPAEGEPEYSRKIRVDPLFKDPGSGGMGFATLEGYQIMEASPAINTGMPIPGNAAKDIWGNEIRSNQALDRGVNEYD